MTKQCWNAHCGGLTGNGNRWIGARPTLVKTLCQLMMLKLCMLFFPLPAVLDLFDTKRPEPSRPDRLCVLIRPPVK
jgi:hypothetical protein